MGSHRHVLAVGYNSAGKKFWKAQELGDPIRYEGFQIVIHSVLAPKKGEFSKQSKFLKSTENSSVKDDKNIVSFSVWKFHEINLEISQSSLRK